MQRTIVRQVRPGMSLARSVARPSAPDEPWLVPGTTITAGVIARLHEEGIYDVWVNHPFLEFFDELYSPDLSPAQLRWCDLLRRGFQSQAERLDTGLPLDRSRDMMQALARAVLAKLGTPAFERALVGVEDCVLRHGAEVACVAMMLGLRLEEYVASQRKRAAGARAADLVSLGMGCLLHDIGETRLAEKHRESRRSEQDDNLIWHDHAGLGYAAMHGLLEPSVAAVILHHHQHFDGSGFPVPAAGMPLKGNQIHIFARLAMAADTLVHFLRRDQVPMPTVHALWRMQQSPCSDRLDPTLLAELLAIIPPFAVGEVVHLSDRRMAVVTRTYPEWPCYPQVQVLGGWDARSPERETIELADKLKLAIQFVDGVDVSGWLYGARRMAPETPQRAVA